MTPVADRETTESQLWNEDSGSHTLLSEPPASANVTPVSAPSRADSALSLLNPVRTAEAAEVRPSPAEVRAKIAELALSQVGSQAWSDKAINGNYGTDTNKCNLFVSDMLTQAGASPGQPHWTVSTRGFPDVLHFYPPLAGEWADPDYKIPGWRVLGQDETPAAGDVVAQRLAYSDASGHVMIVGPDNTVVGTGDSTSSPHGTIEHIPMPDYLGRADLARGPKVFRRWTP